MLGVTLDSSNVHLAHLTLVICGFYSSVSMIDRKQCTPPYTRSISNNAFNITSVEKIFALKLQVKQHTTLITYMLCTVGEI